MEELKLSVLLEETIKKVTSSQRAWLDYLSYHAQFHKYPFYEAILAYAQNPNATMLATSDIWNQVGRQVIDSEGIPVIKFVNGQRSIGVLYDVAQTVGKEINHPDWHYHSEEEEEYIAQYIDEGMPFASNKSLPDKLDRVARELVNTAFYRDKEMYRSQLNLEEVEEKEWLEAAVTTAQYLVRSRVGTYQTVETYNVSYIENLKNNLEHLVSLATLSQNAAKAALKLYADVKQSYQKEKVIKHEQDNTLQEQRERTTDTTNSDVEQSRLLSPDRALRKDRADASAGEKSRAVPDTPDSGNARGNDAQSERKSHQPRDDFDRTVTEGGSGSDEHERVESSTTSESDPERSGGTSDSGNRKLPRLKKNNQEKETNSSDPESEQLSLFNDWDDEVPEEAPAVLSETVKVVEGENKRSASKTSHEPAEVSGEQEKKEEQSKAKNYVYSANDDLYPNGEKTKYQNNVAAIRLLKRLEDEDKEATREEQVVLARYVGWGGLANVFASEPGKWTKEQQELKMLLTEQEYREAMESTLTAYYTPPEIIRGIYKGLNKLGFKKGKILDPAMGSGSFFAQLPNEWRGQTQLTGVELDTLTGRIAQKLYPESDIRVQGFETTPFKENSFDVIVGNIPFGDIPIYDDRFKDKSFLIHDYFMARSVDLVKPGGIVALITSKGTLDKKDSSVREYLCERANLLAAVRLPNTAFKQLAGTSVTADILFFQKLPEQRKIKERAPWLDLADTGAGQTNAYFRDLPEMVLGRMEFDGYYKGGPRYACVPIPGQDLSQQLERAVNKIPGVFSAEVDENQEIAEEQADERLNAPEGMKDYTYQVVDGKLYYGEEKKLTPVQLPTKTESRIKGMCGIRDALLDVINLQEGGVYDDKALSALQRVLTQRYERFVAAYGFLNKRENLRAFYEDIQSPLLASIEDYNKQSESYEKSPVFTKATIHPHTVKTTAASAKEALEMSLNYKMGVDLHYMASVYGKEPDVVLQELGTLVYQNPETFTGDVLSGWETADDYLTGNVHDKLQYAQLKAEEDPERFARNAEALRRVQPDRVLPGDIQFRVGSPWISLEYYRQFMYETFDTASYNQIGDKPSINLEYSKSTNAWHVIGKSIEGNSVKVNTVFGSRRMNAYEIYENMLNLKDVVVRDEDRYLDESGTERKRYVVNVKETMVARQKQQDVLAAFKSWLWKDQARTSVLLDIYNDRYNTHRVRQYDGSYLEFPGMSSDVTLRSHQKNLVARMMATGNALAAHVVGAGKTAALIAGAMKMRQIGAVKKPLIAVMKHTVDQWATEFMRFYPGANILVVRKEDFEKRNRQRFISKIATGDFDSIIISHSQLEKIPISPERQEVQLRKQIATLSYQIQESEKERGNNWGVKQLVSFQKRLNEKLRRLTNRRRKDDVINFEQLGVDALLVDEAQVYKNLFTETRMRNVAGISLSESQRASDMKMKCEYIQERNHNRGIVFATGTPVSNSMAELFVMQKFLQPWELERAGLEFFDKWVGTFGEVQTDLEMTPEGGGYRMRTRFSKFHNLPELMGMFHQVADIQTADMLNLPVPELVGGKAQIISLQPSEYQKKMMESFVERAEKIRNGSVNPREDNMLKLTHEAKLMAIDPRLVDPNAPVQEDSKLNACADKVYEIWQRTSEKKSTQLIFCDSGTPKNDRFNVYNEVKRLLVDKGISPDEIAFIHDAKTDVQREALFNRVRSGECRVLMGSTSKLGTGTNVQDLLVAGFHIDCPWKPADVEQRDGRVVRQGNQNKEVYLYRCITRGTFDGYLWQIQEQKLRYISQVMTNRSVQRAMNDVDETVLNAAQVKAAATDNPLLLEKMTLDNEVSRLQMIQSRWMNEKAHLQSQIEKDYPEEIKHLTHKIMCLDIDSEIVQEHASDAFSMVLDGKKYFDKKEAGKRVSELIKTIPLTDIELHVIGQYKGMAVTVQHTFGFETRVGLKNQSQNDVLWRIDEKSNIERVETIALHLPVFLKDAKQQLSQANHQLEEASKEVNKPFEHAERLQELEKRQAELNLKLEFMEKGDAGEKEARVAPDEDQELQKEVNPSDECRVVIPIKQTNRQAIRTQQGLER